ncbi:MAG: single-stranded-DNA-specific exonuclease RecJ, partial [Hyphomicrobiaceae bacterium]|nr:single-stranded-DNA-specific exonuclease RecJ [Hyphomicrobiaceae bacterium]
MSAVRQVKQKAQIDDGAYMGVTQSARGYRWQERLAGPAAHALATAMSQHHGLPDLMGRVLAARGIKLDEVPVFLDPSLKALMPDPSSLHDMDKAAARIADAIEASAPVAIFGDYDVDGACSSA